MTSLSSLILAVILLIPFIIGLFCIYKYVKKRNKVCLVIGLFLTLAIGYLAYMFFVADGGFRNPMVTYGPPSEFE